ncbi:hypothetical protein ACHHYP_12555 [Achlya hypogyna]|uniref:Secreted protein n=1 Tax=Achlya hypogyna TaxID=1202772 RepID=A0A0A7CP40_ACHHY|nr:secreted protein [Achlya hypogyna]OQR84926.1 hypothetical protein ACHHYP_12555 [Achlya hypogyna]
MQLMRSLLTALLAFASIAVASHDGCFSANDVYETLVISSGSASPDCVLNNKVLLVNGSFTGPTLTVYQGDKLHLTIVNELDSMFSMHIHGANQFGTPFSDGAAGINAIPMAPKSTATRSSIMSEAGTFFYHAHFKLMDMHVYGALIVKERGEEHEDLVVVLSDYWRADLDALHYGLLDAPSFQFVGLPNSFLTNGKSVSANCTSPGASITTINVKPQQTYRVRVIGGTSLFGVHFRVPQHTMTIVEIEGTKVEPKAVDYIEVLPGQRYTFLLKTDQPVDNYYMQFDGRWRAGAPTNGVSILHYEGAPTPSASNAPPRLPLIAETVSFNEQFVPLTHRNVPASTGAPLRFAGKQVAWGPSGTQRRWSMNNVTYVKQMSTSVLEVVIAQQVGALPAASQPTTSISKGAVVDIVFENAVAINGVCEMHPWHLHGHSFWVVGAGPGAYDPAAPLFKAPIRRDVVGVYPYTNAYNQPAGTNGAACGWVQIRFVADNIGVWPVHCHVASHFDMGMAVVLVVGENELHDPAVVAALRAASA